MVVRLSVFLLLSLISTEDTDGVTASPILEEGVTTTFDFFGHRLRIWPSRENNFGGNTSGKIFFYEPTLVPFFNTNNQSFIMLSPDPFEDRHRIKLILNISNSQVHEMAYNAVKTAIKTDVKKENVRPLPVLSVKLTQPALFEDLPNSNGKYCLDNEFENPGPSVELLLRADSEGQAKQIAKLLENGQIAYSMDFDQNTIIGRQTLICKNGKPKYSGLLKGNVNLREFKCMQQVHALSRQLQELSQKVEMKEEQMTQEIKRQEVDQSKINKMLEQIVNLKEQLNHITGSCPPLWTGMCFLGICSCYRLFEEEKTWQDASKSCKRYGSELASVHSAEENVFIAKLVITTVDTWIGLSDLSEEGLYQWSDGTPLDFTWWHREEPSDRNSTENCVEMRLFVSKEWNDIPCSEGRQFICKQNSDLRTRKEEDQTERCPIPSWTRVCFLDSCFCYQVFTERKTWEDASQSCRSSGSELASIHSTEENFFVAKLITTTVFANTWIGFNDILKEGRHQWSDQTQPDFSMWGENEPNDLTRQENCVEMKMIRTLGTWNDLRCSWERQYICKQRV